MQTLDKLQHPSISTQITAHKRGYAYLKMGIFHQFNKKAVVEASREITFYFDFNETHDISQASKARIEIRSELRLILSC